MINQEKISAFPEKPGVYIMKNKKGEIIYVGKAISLKNRVRSYFQSPANQPARVASMVSFIEDIEYIVTDSEIEALILECNLIKHHRPRYNILLKDDKQYPYLKINLKEPFPRLELVRRIEKDGAKYFGPYANQGALRDAIEVIRKVFPIRNCKKDLSVVPLKERPCLNFHINRCLAPCQGRIKAGDYDEIIQDVVTFLEGKQEGLLKKLGAKMAAAAENLDFEGAQRYKDQVEALQKILEKQKIVSVNLEDRDAIAMARGDDTACIQVFFIRGGKLVEREPFILRKTDGVGRGEILSSFVKQFYDNAEFIPKDILVAEMVDDAMAIEGFLTHKKGSKVTLTVPQRGEKRQLADMVAKNAREYLEQIQSDEERDRIYGKGALEELQYFLGMKCLPNRVEAYDISNTQGTSSVASMIVFEGGFPKKSDYRRFKIRTVEGPNDFESMKEAVSRRFKRAAQGDDNFGALPDLVLIDGGKGQLKYANEALRELGFSHIPAIGLAEQFEHIFVEGRKDPIILPEGSPGLYLVKRIRDEAHRFAITYHKSLRSKQNIRSVLEDIPGIGKARRLALLKTFEGIEGIKKAEVNELTDVPGMNIKAAEAVYNYFRRQKSRA